MHSPFPANHHPHRSLHQQPEPASSFRSRSQSWSLFSSLSISQSRALSLLISDSILVLVSAIPLAFGQQRLGASIRGSCQESVPDTHFLPGDFDTTATSVPNNSERARHFLPASSRHQSLIQLYLLALGNNIRTITITRQARAHPFAADARCCTAAVLKYPRKATSFSAK